MEFHGPCLVVGEVPGGAVVAPPPIHLDGHARDVASSWGQQEADWTGNLHTKWRHHRFSHCGRSHSNHSTKYVFSMHQKQTLRGKECIAPFLGDCINKQTKTNPQFSIILYVIVQEFHSRGPIAVVVPVLEYSNTYNKIGVLY